MADETVANANAQANAPSFNLIGQYIRDMSFENPGAPGSIMMGGANPNFSVGINVGVKKQADDIYAVEITLNAKAEREKAVLFNVELVYGGVFRMKNIPENQLAPLLLVECPRLIFPFARQVLATITQQGGFPPLMMEPVDFNAIYLQNLKSLQAAQAAGQTPDGSATPQVTN
ncbi:MAG: protein-export chaperone SecB [Devosia nanyangense]|uniref:Protein-export protein SecB n=1 Tax=Devosia nanyangense TaxID=1228055 RepID=A0A933L1E6_9HYPH|nr:protein-export chaperone SecB [Devosia nanyangense]